MISGFRRWVNMFLDLLGRYVALIDILSPTFRYNRSVPTDKLSQNVRKNY